MNTRRAGSRSSWPSNHSSPSPQDVGAVLLGGVRGLFFARDPSPREETPERAVADREAAARECSPQLLERDIRRLLDKREDQAGPRLNASRAPVAAQSLRPGVALYALQGAPADRARRAHAKPLGGLPTRKAARNRGEHTCPEIERECLRHVCRPPPGRQLNHRCADLAIDFRSDHSSDHALKGT